MAIIPIQNNYPDRAGYLGLDTDRNVLVGMSDGILQDMTNSTPEGWVNVKDFGAVGDRVHDDTQAIQSAIEFLRNNRGGVVHIPAGEYRTTNSIVVGEGITISGVGSSGRSNTSIFYEGTESAFKFYPNSQSAVIKDINILSYSTSPNYQNFIGIDIDYVLFTTIKRVHIIHPRIGINLSGANGFISKLKCDQITIKYASEYGVYIDKNGSWKNGLTFNFRELSRNNIGFYAGKGSGNEVIGGNSVIGENNYGLVFDGEDWSIRGPLWIENSNVYGLDVRSGNVTIESELRISDEINVEPEANLIFNAINLYSELIEPKIKFQDAYAWFSFDEKQGTTISDKTKNNFIAKFSNPLIWTNEGTFGHSAKITNTAYTESGDSRLFGKQTDPNSFDWSKDWTLLVNARQTHTQFFNVYYKKFGTNEFLSLKFKLYPDGLQIVNSKDGFETKFLNLRTFPSNPDSYFNWYVITYNGNTHEVSSYNTSGKLSTTLILPYPINKTDYYKVSEQFSYHEVVTGITKYTEIDEFILFQRRLMPHEIRQICHMADIPHLYSISKSATIPKTSYYNKGDVIYNNNPTIGSPVGWICLREGYATDTWNNLNNKWSYPYELAFVEGEYVQPTTPNDHYYISLTKASSGNQEPIWTTENGSIVYDQPPTSATTWLANTTYSIGDLVLPTLDNHCYYKCIQAGTSGTTEPTWSTEIATEITDNTVKWETRLLGKWQEAGVPAKFGTIGTIS